MCKHRCDRIPKVRQTARRGARSRHRPPMLLKAVRGSRLTPAAVSRCSKICPINLRRQHVCRASPALGNDARKWFFSQWVKSVEEGAGGGGSACVTGWPDQRPAYSSSIMPNNLLWRMKGGLAGRRGRSLSVERERALHTTSATGNQRYSTTYLRNNQKNRTTKNHRQ